MAETLSRSELMQRQRLPYGAVPLDPWRAVETSYAKSLYSIASIVRIEKGLTRSMVDQDWFRRSDKAHDLYTLMKGSLLESQFRRIDKNNTLDMEKMAEVDDPRVTLALKGLATPSELFTLLGDYPDIGSLELAKLSHPFDFKASDEMDSVMEDLMLCSEGELLGSGPRYKLKRVDEDMPAGVVLRKQDLMDFPTENGTIRIVQRRGLLVFDGDGVQDEPHFDRLLKNPKNMPTLAAKIERYISDGDRQQPYGWVQPQATSYYAKYIDQAI